MTVERVEPTSALLHALGAADLLARLGAFVDDVEALGLAVSVDVTIRVTERAPTTADDGRADQDRRPFPPGGEP